MRNKNKLGLLLSYSSIYKDKAPEIADILKDIPSRIIIMWLSILNHKIQNENDNDVFYFFSHGWGKERIIDLLKRKKVFDEENQINSLFFFELATTEFIKYELLNYRDFEFKKPDTDWDDLYNIYTAYLILADKVLEEQYLKIKLPDEASNEALMEILWPIALKQFEFKQQNDPIFDAIKLEIFFQYFLVNDKYKNIFTDYLSSYKLNNSWELISMYIEMFNFSKLQYDPIISRPVVFSKSTDSNHNYIENITINPVIFKNETIKHKYFIGLKEKPLFKFSPDQYIVMNWRFIYDQIYTGIIFDIYNRSGVQALHATYPDFKTVISDEVIEKQLFRNIFQVIFDRSRFVVEFPEGNGVLDAYVREGKYIYLFELKDSAPSLALIESATYSDFKENLNKTFVANQGGSPKGITQLINNIKKLSNNCFDFDNYVLKGIKKRNIIVYPIIIYTSSYYSLPGVNKYLNDIYKSDLPVDLEFKSFDLTLISLKHLTKIGKHIHDGNLKEIIKNYHLWVVEKTKSVVKRRNMDDVIKIYSSIEDSPQNEKIPASFSYTNKLLAKLLPHIPNK